MTLFGQTMRKQTTGIETEMFGKDTAANTSSAKINGEISRTNSNKTKKLGAHNDSDNIGNLNSPS
jgi:hypothetical protein